MSLKVSKRTTGIGPKIQEVMSRPWSPEPGSVSSQSALVSEHLSDSCKFQDEMQIQVSRLTDSWVGNCSVYGAMKQLPRSCPFASDPYCSSFFYELWTQTEEALQRYTPYQAWLIWPGNACYEMNLQMVTRVQEYFYQYFWQIIFGKPLQHE